jgi:hypothetical protein
MKAWGTWGGALLSLEYKSWMALSLTYCLLHSHTSIDTLYQIVYTQFLIMTTCLFIGRLMCIFSRLLWVPIPIALLLSLLLPFRCTEYVLRGSLYYYPPLPNFYCHIVQRDNEQRSMNLRQTQTISTEQTAISTEETNKQTSLTLPYWRNSRSRLYIHRLHQPASQPAS